MGVKKKKKRAPHRRKKKKRSSRKNRNGRSQPSASKWKPPAGKALKQLREDWDHVT